MNELDVQLGFYLPHEAIAQGELRRASYYLSLAMQVEERSPVSAYLAAETYARLNATREALGALRRAVEVGFRDLPALETAAAFQHLRQHPEFLLILELLRNTGDRLDPLTVDRPPFVPFS